MFCLFPIHVFRYNRIEHVKKMRWEFGSVLPADVKVNLSDQEVGL